MFSYDGRMDAVTGSAIVAERERQHLTRTEAAKVAGVSLRVLQTYEAQEHPTGVQAANMRAVLEALRSRGRGLESVSNADLLVEVARRLAALMDNPGGPDPLPPLGVTVGRLPVD